MTEPRIYNMDHVGITPEQIAVTFARTSRSPEPFDEIAIRVTEETAAQFHEQWVVGYGHASVAEHAILHIAIEDVSRLTIDELEANRLASYTEKSSRFQVIAPHSYHVPDELDDHPHLRSKYCATMDCIFANYGTLLEKVIAYIKSTDPVRPDETISAHRLRIRRRATDAVRNVLPAALLTNVGLTANARTLEHAISKLMSNPLIENQCVGLTIRERAREVTPTLVKYADHNPYLADAHHRHQSDILDEHVPEHSSPRANILRSDPNPVITLARNLLFTNATSYSQAARTIGKRQKSAALEIIRRSVEKIGPHDPLPREFETISYLIEFTMDYGALREFRRHRMMTPISQPLNIANGYDVPILINESLAAPEFIETIHEADILYNRLADVSPFLAQYAVTHAHLQRILVNINLRQLHHFFHLRTSAQAHPSIRKPATEALNSIRSAQPELTKIIFPDS